MNVYWACVEAEWMAATEPESVSKLFYEKYKFDKSEPDSMLNNCPSFNGHLKNLFAVRSLYDYEFKIDGDNVTSQSNSNLDKRLVVRSLSNRFFTFFNKYIFFTDSPSLNVTFYEHPYLEDNDISSRCMIPSATFDIGKWFRPSEFPFFLKKEYNSFKINRGDIYSYIRFHTDDKIKFKEFRFNRTLSDFMWDSGNLQNGCPMGSLANYYKSFRSKKLIMKEIKENLVESK
jgi:hypothetical protein